MSCGKCHKCGGPILVVNMGEEWCSHCQTYQRPFSHGWGRTKFANKHDAEICEESAERIRGEIAYHALTGE